MGYLNPPPGDAPVIVMRDFGGDVRQYAAMTNAYIRSGREVRLHECRSACTLALAAPNVCVYPNSVLRFHKAYNPLTKATNEEVSAAMQSAYPPAVRARLGVLSRQYKSLTGSELIRLGVRDCNAPAPKVMIARAGAEVNIPGASVSTAFTSLLPGFFATKIPAYGGSAQVPAKRVRTQVAEAAPTAEAPRPEALGASGASAGAPVPPPRPADVYARDASEAGPPAGSAPEAQSAPSEAKTTETSERPIERNANWGATIDGAAPVLAAARFAPFPYRLTARADLHLQKRLN